MATETYPFPGWAHALGWLLIISVLMWIPLYWVFAFFKAKGDTFKEVGVMRKSSNCSVNDNNCLHFKPVLLKGTATSCFLTPTLKKTIEVA